MALVCCLGVSSLTTVGTSHWPQSIVRKMCHNYVVSFPSCFSLFHSKQRLCRKWLAISLQRLSFIFAVYYWAGPRVWVWIAWSWNRIFGLLWHINNLTDTKQTSWPVPQTCSVSHPDNQYQTPWLVLTDRLFFYIVLLTALDTLRCVCECVRLMDMVTTTHRQHW